MPTEAEIDVREWRPEDGDTRCQNCGYLNPIWWADNRQWNATVGGPDAADDPGGVLCPTCYHALWLGHEVRPRGPVTDAEVEAALNAYLNMDAAVAQTTAAADWRKRNASYMRAALEAARKASHG